MSGLGRALAEHGLAGLGETLLVWKLWRPWQKRRWVARCLADEAAHPLDLGDRTWQWAAPGDIPPDWYSPHFPLSREDQERLPAAAWTPVEVEGLRDRCAQIDRGDFSWLMAGAPALGPLPDWHALLDRAGSWPDVPSDQIDYLSEARPADIRRIWELNRHQYFMVLGRAWRLERDPRWAACFARHLGDWIRRNPPGRGPNWTQAQEVGLRAVSWCWAWHLFHDAPAFTPELRGTMLRALSWHLRFLERETCAFGKWTHNHLISELAGLHLVSSLFPQMRQAGRLERWSRRLLLREAGKQVWPDGLAGELATAYMGFVLDTLCGVLACRRESWRGSVLEERVAAMGGAMAWLTRPDGSLPSVGDSDDGRGWILSEEPVRRSAYGQLPALLLGGRVEAWVAAEEDVAWRWLFPAAAERCSRQGEPAPAGRVFREGGIWSWRRHAGQDSDWLLLRGGATRRRRWVQQGHHHADLLSFEYVHGGRPLLLDPGSYAYGRETALRLRYRGSRVHNGLWVEDLEPCDFRGLRFGVWDLPLSRWIQAPTAARPEACLEFSRGAVTHRRLLRPLPDGFELVDWIRRPAERCAELGFQLAPGIEARAGTAGWTLPGLGLALEVESREGGPALARIDQGRVSRRYGEEEAALRLCLELPPLPLCRIVTRLRPTSS
jgi:hypothetical protein